MNTVEIDKTMMATTVLAVEIDELKKIVANLDEWSYETWILKNGAD